MSRRLTSIVLVLALLAAAIGIVGLMLERFRADLSVTEIFVEPVLDPKPNSTYPISLTVINRQSRPIRIVGLPFC